MLNGCPIAFSAAGLGKKERRVSVWTVLLSKAACKNGKDRIMERIESERLYLRPFGHGDAEAVWAYRSLAEVARYQYWEPYTPEDARSFIERYAGQVPGETLIHLGENFSRLQSNHCDRCQKHRQNQDQRTNAINRCNICGMDRYT